MGNRKEEEYNKVESVYIRKEGKSYFKEDVESITTEYKEESMEKNN